MEILFNRGRVADGSLPFDDSMYGFKVHAIKPHLEHFDYVVFCDPAMVLLGDINELLTICDNNSGVYAVKDDNKLSTCISDLALEHWHTTRHKVEQDSWNLVGGSLYIFNSNSPVAMAVFEDWYRSEMMGIFGSSAQAASGRINSHRHDESCLAMAMYTNLVYPIPYDVAKYCNGDHSIMIKKHFK
jgi:hypothetical protein